MLKGGICYFVLLFLTFIVFVDKAQCDLSLNNNYYFARFQLYLAFAHAKSIQKAGLLNEPIKSFNRTLDLARRVGDSFIEAECLIALGILCWDKGEVGLSSRYFLKALTISPHNGSRNIDVFCKTAINIHSLFNEAKGLRINKQFARAKDKYLQAIFLARKIKSANHEVKCLRQMSAIYFNEFDLKNYLALNKHALFLAKRMRIIREEGYCCYNIALYYLRAGFFYESANYFSKSLEIAKALRDPEDEIDCYNNIGFILSELGNYRSSLEYFKKALSLVTGDIKKAEILNSIGVYVKLNAAETGDIYGYFDANAYFRKALNLAIECKNPTLIAIILNNIGMSYFARKKYQPALFYLKESLSAGKNESSLDYVSDTLTNIGNVYFEIKKYDEAERYYRQAVKLIGKESVPKILWGSYFGLGQCFEKKDKISKAIYYYKKSISLIESVDNLIEIDFEKANYLKNKIIVYENLIKLIFTKLNDKRSIHNNDGLKNELLLYIEKAKAKSLSDYYLGKKKQNINSYLFDGVGNEELSMSLSLSPLGISSTKQIINNIKADSSSSILKKLNALINYIHKNESILIYSVGEDFSILAVIMNGDIKYYQLPSRNEIEKSIRGYLKLISTSSTNKFIGGKAASRILNEIFFPIQENEFQGVKKVIIIPDGLLFYLPFESLVLGNPDSESCMFVIEKYDVSYAPSLSFLYYLDQKSSERTKKVNCLIVGDPDYDSLRMRDENKQLNIVMNKLEGQGFSLDPLPFTKEEAILIRNVIRPKNSMICLNKEASEDNIKKIDLKKYNIIHFACHGFIDEETPTRSALVLSYQHGSKQDGLLQVAEIYNLRLEADLVVLSACQTGRGLIARGEGILGLAKTFFYSGARSVISTLWNINDISTAIFMKNFYLFLYSGMTKSEALRFAKVKMIHSQYSHPFYWAAFILSGDYRSRFDWR